MRLIVGRHLILMLSALAITLLCSVRLILASDANLLQTSNFAKSGSPNFQAAQIFVFSTSNKNWQLYNWNKLTTLVEVGYHDDELVKYAHSKNVSVSSIANIDTTWLANSTRRSEWVNNVVKDVLSKNLDGVNVDFEDAIYENETDRRAGLTLLLKELSTTLKAALPRAQITIDFAYSPACIDARCYDYAALAEIADFVFVMAYDERSQIRGPCIAWANSPYNVTFTGLKLFSELKIPSSKVVLGVPWYGYDYTCVSYVEKSHTCYIKPVPFRGVNCSDAAGRQFGSTYMMEKANESLTGLLWDKVAMSPYATYKDSKSGELHQIWFDNILSLQIKYQLARHLDLLGVGMWEADSLDYADTETKRAWVREMWNALPDRKH